jgi:Tfp pilus assembly protein PilF
MGGAALLVLLLAGPLPGPPAAEDARRAEARQAYDEGEELLRGEDFERAAEEFRRAIALDPLMWIAHYELGQTEMARKRYVDAIAAYVGCREVFMQMADVDVSVRGERERERDDEIRELKESLQQVRSGKLKLGPNELGVELRLEERLNMLESGRLKGNEQTVGVPAPLFLALGSARFRAGQVAEAQAEFEAAVKADPGLGAAHNNLAVIYMMAGRFDDARQAVRKAKKAGVHVNPQLPDEIERRAKAAGH